MTEQTQPTDALAKLRHLYANMINGGVRDTASAKRIAEGLLSPAIEALEKWGTPAGAASGLPTAQEPKYTVTGTHIVNRVTGEAVPHDEPVFVFRARDALGVRALEAYLALIGEREPSSEHANAVRGRIADFQRFAASHPARMKWPDTTAQAAESVPAQVLVAALIAAKQAINSMKAEAETAAQGDEQMMLEACETISNEGLQADIAIRAALASAQQPAPSAAVLDYPHARRFGGCPACGRSDCVAMSCTRTTSDDLLHIAARKQGGA